MITLAELRKVQGTPSSILEKHIDEEILKAAKEGKTGVTVIYPSEDKDLLDTVVGKYSKQGYHARTAEVRTTDPRGDYTLHRFTTYVLHLNWGHLL